MEKMIPYAKLSKKEKRRQDLLGRNTWGSMSPVTRMPVNSRAYNRKRHRIGRADSPIDPVSLLLRR